MDIHKTVTFGRPSHGRENHPRRAYRVDPCTPQAIRGARSPPLGNLVNGGTKWKRLTRNDLATFDTYATAAVLTAMDHGAIGRVSRRGHVTIRGRDGQTMSVTRDTSAPHTAQNIRADLRRLFPETKVNGTTAKNGAKDLTMTATNIQFTNIESRNGAPEEVQVAPSEDDLLMLKCPAKGCDKEFVTGGARYKHINDDHATCTWEGCNLGPDGTAFVGSTVQSVAGHVNIQHRGNKPWEHRDPNKRRESARKGAATRAAKREHSEPREVVSTVPKLANSTTVEEMLQSPNTVAAVRDSSSVNVEHRGLPKGGVTHKPATAAAKLAAIRQILGEDPQVAILKSQIEELKAQLDLVAEVLHLGKSQKSK